MIGCVRYVISSWPSIILVTSAIMVVLDMLMAHVDVVRDANFSAIRHAIPNLYNVRYIFAMM
jgi:hypothetical protein